MDKYKINKSRLSDRILEAMELALEQHDPEIAEILNRALDLSMTRNTGGGEFIERRDYPKIIEDAITHLKQLQGKK
jgi:hypothetical protein